MRVARRNRVCDAVITERLAWRDAEAIDWRSDRELVFG